MSSFESRNEKGEGYGYEWMGWPCFGKKKNDGTYPATMPAYLESKKMPQRLIDGVLNN